MNGARRRTGASFRLAYAAVFATAFAAALAGCAAPSGVPGPRLALEGPPLFIAVSGGGSRYGAMDRGCLAGVGGIILQDPQRGVTCEGTMDAPASSKGRLYAELACSDGGTVVLGLRNTGPDQGVGVGRVMRADGEREERISLFYHPCEDEARRRLVRVEADMAEAERRAAETK